MAEDDLCADYHKRAEDPLLCSITKKIDENSDELKDLHAALRFHIEAQNRSVASLAESTQRINDRIQPVFELMDDIATVGRMGKHVKALVTWCAVVCGSVVAVWQYITHFEVK